MNLTTNELGHVDSVTGTDVTFSQVDDEENEKNIFLLGLFVLFAWMLVIILCASPQLFRDFIERHFCCCWWKAEQKSAESIREAHERMLLANQSFLRSTIADNPSKILVSQVMRSGMPRYSRIDIPEPIPEESRGSSVQPRSLSISSSATNSTNARQHEVKSRTHSVSFLGDAPANEQQKIIFNT